MSLIENNLAQFLGDSIDEGQRPFITNPPHYLKVPRHEENLPLPVEEELEEDSPKHSPLFLQLPLSERYSFSSNMTHMTEKNSTPVDELPVITPFNQSLPNSELPLDEKNSLPTTVGVLENNSFAELHVLQTVNEPSPDCLFSESGANPLATHIDLLETCPHLGCTRDFINHIPEGRNIPMFESSLLKTAENVIAKVDVLCEPRLLLFDRGLTTSDGVFNENEITTADIPALGVARGMELLTVDDVCLSPTVSDLVQAETVVLDDMVETFSSLTLEEVQENNSDASKKPPPGGGMPTATARDETKKISRKNVRPIPNTGKKCQTTQNKKKNCSFMERKENGTRPNQCASAKQLSKNVKGGARKVFGWLQWINDKKFGVNIEGEIDIGQLNAEMNCLSDLTVPLIVLRTKLQLKVTKLKGYYKVLSATVIEYTKVTPSDVCKAIESLPHDLSHEEFVKKLYFSWKPFLTAVLLNAHVLDQLSFSLVLQRILPVEPSPHDRRNKSHSDRFQEIIKMVASSSAFLQRLTEFDNIDLSLAKQLTDLVVHTTRRPIIPVPIIDLLKKYYKDDSEGLLGFIEQYSFECDLTTKSLSELNFRNIPIIPVMDELKGVINSLVTKSGKNRFVQNLLLMESHLVPNCVDRPWDSFEEFIDAHFRLLREECFASIRNRIATVRLEPYNYQCVHRVVRVVGCAISNGTIVVRVMFEPHRSRANMMLGNLLCIDVDTHFNNPIWAVVDSSELTKNEVDFTIVGVGNCYIGTSENTDCNMVASTIIPAIQRLMSCQLGVMVESPTYFNAFRPVLARLQNMYENEFPFISEILLKTIEPQPSPINFVLNDVDCKLDESQKSAAQSSLSSRFSLIQGPPGCGKTFVGKEILKAMLHSKDLKRPILLMTYKNHVLDSILEGCLEFTESLVRIGGKCTSEIIEEYNFHKFYKESLQFNESIRLRELNEARSKLEDLKSELNECVNLFLSDITSEDLLSYLKRSAIGREQLHFLMCHNFGSKYGQLVKQHIYFESFEAVDKAVDDILMGGQNFAGKLLRLSFKEWLPYSKCAKFLPHSRESLFIDQPTIKKKKKNDLDGGDQVEEDLEATTAERSIAPKHELNFINPCKHGKFYPDLQMKKAYMNSDRRERDVQNVTKVWSLSHEGRFILLSYWMRECRREKDEYMAKTLEEYCQYDLQVKSLEDKRHVALLKSKDIVACTITGSCLKMGVLSKLAPSVVIVEEAAEILESQLVAALPSSVQHLVLIGDHKQLPPQVHHQRLAKHFNLGVSIFERLANNGFPVQQLQYHRRGPTSLCPLFSNFYQQQVVPLKKNVSLPDSLLELGPLYWWTHDMPASRPPNGTSFENEYEAAMVVGAVRLLTSEGHICARRISIITAYLGQANMIKILLNLNEVEGVTVSTIDGYQGDENDFIFLSLTRSSSECVEANKTTSLGFLASPNRACVALSRAKQGLYIFGCSSLFEKHPSWKEAVKYLKSNEKVGRELRFVISQNHLMFEHPNDFSSFFKKLELKKEEIKLKIQDKFLDQIPPEAREGIHDVTKAFGEKIESLMNKSVLDRKDLGRGRDADGLRFNRFKVINVKQIFKKDVYFLYLHHLEMIKQNTLPPLGFEVDTRTEWLDEMSNKCGNEVFLFHGTKPDVSGIIAESGFDERVASMGGMYGAGIYFAENADKSDQYTSSGGTRMMFLARVILGNPYKTMKPENNLRRPPPIDPSKPTKLHDSVIAVSGRKSNQSAANHRHQEFIVFDRYQCVPMFLIEYKHQ